MLYDETFEGYKNKLKGRLYGVLCEKEKEGGDWEKFLNSILIELKGLFFKLLFINILLLLLKYKLPLLFTLSFLTEVVDKENNLFSEMSIT